MKDVAIGENHLYNKTFKSGARACEKHVCVYVLRDWGAKRQMLKNPEKKFINRIGLSVTKKLGGAVERNRAKRVIRAGLADARKRGELRTGYLIVIAARFGCDKAKSTEISDELTSAFLKLDMYRRVFSTVTDSTDGTKSTENKTDTGHREAGK